VEGTTSVVWPHYSYWTLGYILTYHGAWKLVQQNPLGKLVPVDEYLPIMFNHHPEYVHFVYANSNKCLMTSLCPIPICGSD